MMEKDRWLIYIERNCKHGRMQAHGVVGVIHGEGIPECYGGDRILIGGFTMNEEAIDKWRKVASSVD